MYNYKNIEKFMDEVTKEAMTEAQKVFDKYTPELKEMVLAQMMKGDKFIIGMGTAMFERNGDNLQSEGAQQLAGVLANTQYMPDEHANFILDDFTKPNN